MKITRFICMSLLTSISLVVVSGCSSGPTKRYVDGRWNVSENVCSSNPDKPDLGDMRSEIRQLVKGISGQRIVTMYYLDRTIFKMEENFNGRSSLRNLTVFKNSVDNPIVENREIRNNREVNRGIKQALVDFFKDDPKIDGRKASTSCLYRGQ